MTFYANFTDGTLLSVREGRNMPKKPDGHGTVTVTHTTLDGAMITVCSDGAIVQQNPNMKGERYRVISGHGSVTCVTSDGTRQILLPNGDTATISADGTRRERDGAAQRSAVAVDPETNALVEVRQSGVVIVTHTDGSRIAYHRNGTRILTTASRSHALVTARGFADTCIDIGVNLAAQRHADGQRVAVTKGGLRTRSVVRVSDGTQLEAQYNTKVVAEVNGRVVVSCADGTSVVAKDSGRVEFLPPSLDHAAAHSDEDDDRDALQHNGVYYFNCRDGAFSLCDAEQNVFHVDMGDGRGVPSVVTQLAGVLSDADAEKYGVEPIPARPVVNEPIEPFLFVLHGDGSGTEILRDRDIAYFLRQAPLRAEEVTNPMPFRDTADGWTQERVFQRQLVPDETRALRLQRAWFRDSVITDQFARLKVPVAAALKFLQFFSEPLARPELQFTVVRQLQQLRPFDSSHLNVMLQSVERWREWERRREATKDRFKVEDPRSSEQLAQEVLVQRKVLAAYKAARAKKKLERQKQRELQRKQRRETMDKGGSTMLGANNRRIHMETVQESDEPTGDQPQDDGDDEELAFLGSDSEADSTGDVDVEVDDPDELMWTAYSAADTDGFGRLSLGQGNEWTAKHGMTLTLACVCSSPSTCSGAGRRYHSEGAHCAAPPVPPD
ncbi:hypothetical protein PINS_up004698 [Pythium insidiosum]|nr:hypothetical protein PINS_up004698 [Pythium insidiosum]